MKGSGVRQCWSKISQRAIDKFTQDFLGTLRHRTAGADFPALTDKAGTVSRSEEEHDLADPLLLHRRRQRLLGRSPVRVFLCDQDGKQNRQQKHSG